jgi:hypothetical protein
MAAEVLAGGIWSDFFCAEVYGSCTELRELFEARGRAYVLHVPRNFRLTLPGGRMFTCTQAVSPEGARHRPGSSAPGQAPRASAGIPGPGWPPLPRWHHLLVHRYLKTGELAFH